MIMNMKDHILAALREQFNGWEKLLASLSEEEIITPHFDLDWSIKDVIAHLWAWQQISIARMEGGLQDREPDYPKWIVESIENWEEDSNRVNALTFENLHNKSWLEIHESWKNGFLRLLEVANEVSEINLLSTGLFPWLNGYSLALILIASYDHHQEHFDKLTLWLRQQGID
jgi:hypothetical protein